MESHSFGKVEAVSRSGFAGLRMPIWAWIGCVALVGYTAFQLWRAATLGRLNAGVADFTRSNSPVAFWFQVFMFALCVILFGGGMLVIIAHSAGLI